VGSQLPSRVQTALEQAEVHAYQAYMKISPRSAAAMVLEGPYGRVRFEGVSHHHGQAPHLGEPDQLFGLKTTEGQCLLHEYVSVVLKTIVRDAEVSGRRGCHGDGIYRHGKHLSAIRGHINTGIVSLDMRGTIFAQV
jgi:hypothetical protein